MKSVLPILLAFFVAVLLADAARVVAQMPTPAMPISPVVPVQTTPTQVPEIWLMLKNGSTFSARMLSAGERVKLRVNDGDIEVRASEISLTGYSLTDLAEQQWALLHQQQLDKQFPFVDWCTRYHLYEHAEAALAQMEKTGQDTPRIKGYQVRLKRLREIHAEQVQAQQQAAAAPLAAAPQPASMVQPAVLTPPQHFVPAPVEQPAIAKPQAAGYSGVQTASHAIPAAPALPYPLPTQPIGLPAGGIPAPYTPPSSAPAPVTPAPAASAPSLLLPATTSNVPLSLTPPTAKPQASSYTSGETELNAANQKPAHNSPNPGNLPPAAVELFSARVQPWVVSRCSNVGCHDNGAANSYKLERYSKQEAIPRATTLKNLAATTRLILTDKPEESPLLVMSNRAHGTSLTPPLAAGDAYAMAAFREFVTLATGRELPKEVKPDPKNANVAKDLPGQVTPGRATFPASAGDESTPENQPAKVINQNAAGWQAAIERQRAYDAEAQKLKNLEKSSQRANEARGLIVDPAVKPAAVSEAAPEILRNLPADAKLFDNDAAKARISLEAAAVKPAANHVEAPVVSPATSLPHPTSTNALPESLLPKSIAKSKVKPDVLPPEEPTPGNTAREPMTESPETTGTKNLAAGQNKPASPPINLNRARRQFPLPPEDTPQTKGVGTGEIKRR